MIKRVITALVLAALGVSLATGADGSGCKFSSPPPPPKKVEPAPNPDPAKPQPGRSFPGNVSITFWVTSSGPIVAGYNIGHGFQSHHCDRSCHWDATTKPGQTVYVVVSHKDHRFEALLEVEVVQNNNGRSLCKDSNADRDPIDGVQCTGTVVI